MSFTVPSLAECAEALRVSETEPRFIDCYDAAIAQQARDCDLSSVDYTHELREAAFRRVSNLWASKAHTLGVLDTGTDYGVQYVPRYDPIIDSLEAPYRRETTVTA